MRVGVLPRLLLAAGVLLAGVSAACEDDKIDTAQEIAAAASEAMAGESFSYTNADCPDCTPPELYEFAPHMAKLSHGAGHDAWQYALILKGEGYLSNDGRRWLTGSEALEFLNLTLLDPRVGLIAVQSPKLDDDEMISDREAAVVTGELDVDAFMERLLPLLREPESEASARELVGGIKVRLWIDRENHRVLQMKLMVPGQHGDPPAMQFDYGDVSIPGEVQSMPFDDAHGLAEPVEKAGQKLLIALADYHVAHGSYPPVLDSSTLAAYIPPGDWPSNPISGQPVRQSPDTPGDFDYVPLNGGEHMQFTIYSWDHAQLHYDSSRWGHQDPGQLRQQRR